MFILNIVGPFKLICRIRIRGNTFENCAFSSCFLQFYTGADPVVLLTDALNLALVEGDGGILSREILKSRTSKMRFPAF